MSLDVVLSYVGRGWRVLPLHEPRAGGCTCRLGPECDSAGKHPRVRWPDGQAVSEAQARSWWRRWPTANVGIVTGAVSGLLVLDVDPKNGGGESLRFLEQRYGFADTAVARSGSGGLHVYFAHPGERIGPSAGKLGPGLDIRCDRGLIVAPPSLHASGHRYEWLAEPGALAPCPSWLVTALRPPPPKPSRPIDLSGKGLQRYVEVALERAADMVANAPEGEKHDVLWRQAFALGTLVGAGALDEATVEAVLLGAVESRARSTRAALDTIRRNVADGRRCPRKIST